jgi:hypothetical protein
MPNSAKGSKKERERERKPKNQKEKESCDRELCRQRQIMSSTTVMNEKSAHWIDKEPTRLNIHQRKFAVIIIDH